MNIQEAMKETGKATGLHLPDNFYVALNDEETVGILSLYDFKGLLVHNVPLRDIVSDNWQPYHPKEEIRPKEAGELWANKLGGSFIIHHNMEVSLSGVLVTYSLGKIEETPGNIIHGKDGWKRLHPAVPNEKEIVIEGVRPVSKKMLNGESRVVFAAPNIFEEVKIQALQDTPMTMILIPKENNNE